MTTCQSVPNKHIKSINDVMQNEYPSTKMHLEVYLSISTPISTLGSPQLTSLKHENQQTRLSLILPINTHSLPTLISPTLSNHGPQEPTLQSLPLFYLVVE